ncbi:MAG: prolyl oligopeptidase family serine peptidase [Clostridia bacterium]|nr:prolyl oligopeptidase family serine peptidase [Clostridia bacterium]
MSETMNPAIGGILTGRKLEWFHHKSLAEWGYTEEQTDTFAVLHPSEDCKAESYPLYVVFHSAGHDVYSTVACTWQKGNHDIYHAPTDMFALYLDCRQHANDWWWGGNSAHDVIGEGREGTEKQPVENRVVATIEWVMEHYPIDRNRVYAVGNSMGGSGALGIAMCRGDLFAAVKANVPAGVCHMTARCGLDSDAPEAPEGFRLPDPPVLVDYSAQNDGWSKGHEILYRRMREKKYAVLGYWGMFGHENNNDRIRAVNDLVHSFDLFRIRLNEAYPVFTNADCDDPLPWSDDGSIIHENAGQINSFFRWDKAVETETDVKIPLRLLTRDEWESRVDFPVRAKADVTLRRLQICRFEAGADVTWECGSQSGVVCVDENGLVTVPGVEIGTDPVTLILRKA